MSLNDWLFLGLCGSAIYAKSVAALLFCSMYAVHSFYSPSMEQWARYAALILIDSAMAFAVVAIEPISDYLRRVFKADGPRKWSFARVVLLFPVLQDIAESHKRPSRASVITGVFSGAFLVVNVAGFVAWYLYLPPVTYDAVCSAVYIAMMTAFFIEGSNGRRRLALRRMGVSSTGAPVRARVGVHHKDGGQA